MTKCSEKYQNQAAAKITENKKTSKPSIFENKNNFFPDRDNIIKTKEYNMKIRTDLKPRTINSGTALSNYKKNFSENPKK